MIYLKNKIFNRVLSLFVTVAFLFSQIMVSARENETIVNYDDIDLEAENFDYEDNASDRDSGVHLQPQQIQLLNYEFNQSLGFIKNIKDIYDNLLVNYKSDDP